MKTNTHITHEDEKPITSNREAGDQVRTTSDVYLEKRAQARAEARKPFEPNITPFTGSAADFPERFFSGNIYENYWAVDVNPAPQNLKERLALSVVNAVLPKRWRVAQINKLDLSQFKVKVEKLWQEVIAEWPANPLTHTDTLQLHFDMEEGEETSA